jgi:hypothetical protein
MPIHVEKKKEIAEGEFHCSACSRELSRIDFHFEQSRQKIVLTRHGEDATVIRQESA